MGLARGLNRVSLEDEEFGAPPAGPIPNEAENKLLHEPGLGNLRVIFGNRAVRMAPVPTRPRLGVQRVSYGKALSNVCRTVVETSTEWAAGFRMRGEADRCDWGSGDANWISIWRKLDPIRTLRLGRWCWARRRTGIGWESLPSAFRALDSGNLSKRGETRWSP